LIFFSFDKAIPISINLLSLLVFEKVFKKITL